MKCMFTQCTSKEAREKAYSEVQSGIATPENASEVYEDELSLMGKVGQEKRKSDKIK